MNTEDDLINRTPEPNREETHAPAPSHGPRVTFRGNSYDLTALLALVLGILVLLMCVTLGQFAYCLPFVAIALGIIGLVMAREAADAERTRLWSWLGVGGAGLSLLLIILLIFAYFACIFFMVLMAQNNY